MDKHKLTIRVLVSVIAVLLLVIIYAFVIKPGISGYVVNKQISAYNQGQADLINEILVQMQQNSGSASIPLGNYTLVLGGQLLENSVQ